MCVVINVRVGVVFLVLLEHVGEVGEQFVLVIVLGGGQFGINWPEGYYCQPEGQLIQNCPTPNTIPC